MTDGCYGDGSICFILCAIAAVLIFASWQGLGQTMTLFL